MIMQPNIFVHAQHITNHNLHKQVISMDSQHNEHHISTSSSCHLNASCVALVELIFFTINNMLSFLLFICSLI